VQQRGPESVKVPACQITTTGSDPCVMPVRGHQLDQAFDRIERFVAVQGPTPTMDAVLALQEAVGIDDEARGVIRERIAALAETGQGSATGSVLLGIIVGLFAATEAGERERAEA
jgi:phosphoglycolate phosphatase-like HAD superfamily hydrolase